MELEADNAGITEVLEKRSLELDQRWERERERELSLWVKRRTAARPHPRPASKSKRRGNGRAPLTRPRLSQVPRHQPRMAGWPTAWGRSGLPPRPADCHCRNAARTEDCEPQGLLRRHQPRPPSLRVQPGSWPPSQCGALCSSPTGPHLTILLLSCWGKQKEIRKLNCFPCNRCNKKTRLGHDPSIWSRRKSGSIGVLSDDSRYLGENIIPLLIVLVVCIYMQIPLEQWKRLNKFGNHNLRFSFIFLISNMYLMIWNLQETVAYSNCYLWNFSEKIYVNTFAAL
jgi:hypothetical protein